MKRIREETAISGDDTGHDYEDEEDSDDGCSTAIVKYEGSEHQDHTSEADFDNFLSFIREDGQEEGPQATIISICTARSPPCRLKASSAIASLCL